MRSDSARNSLFYGVVFILVAGIVGCSGVLWKSFIEYTSSASGLTEVFAGISETPPFHSTDSEDFEEAISFGFSVPRGELVRFLEVVQPALNKIVERTGRPARIDISKNEEEIIDKIINKKIDYGSLSALGYARLRKTKSIRPVLQRFSIPPKRTLFLVNLNSKFKRLEDLQDSRIAYKHAYSLPGYLFPRHEIETLGYDPETFFAEETFTENYSSSLLGLINNEFDCAVVSSNFYDEYQGISKKLLRSIHESKPLPGGVYIAHSDLRKSFEEIIVNSFILFSNNLSREKLFSGLFKVKRPDSKDFDFLEKEFSNE